MYCDELRVGKYHENYDSQLQLLFPEIRSEILPCE